LHGGDGLTGSSAVGDGFFEADDGLAGFGVAEFFTGEAFDGLGVGAQGVDGRLELAVSSFCLT
jgi:hypothetical protein